MIATHDKMNIVLSDHGRTQDKAINNLILVQSLLDAALTKLTECQKQLSRKLDETRIQLYHTQNELEASRVHIMMQDEEYTTQLQLTDEFKNDLNVRDGTILELECKS